MEAEWIEEDSVESNPVSSMTDNTLDDAESLSIYSSEESNSQLSKQFRFHTFQPVCNHYCEPSTSQSSQSRTIRFCDSSCEESDSKPFLPHIDPDHLHVLSTIANRATDECVTMYEVDRLQPELELLYSVSAMRANFFKAELAKVEKAVENEINVEPPTSSVNKRKKKHCGKKSSKHQKVSSTVATGSMTDSEITSDSDNRKKKHRGKPSSKRQEVSSTVATGSMTDSEMTSDSDSRKKNHRGKTSPKHQKVSSTVATGSKTGSEMASGSKHQKVSSTVATGSKTGPEMASDSKHQKVSSTVATGSKTGPEMASDSDNVLRKSPDASTQYLKDMTGAVGWLTGMDMNSDSDSNDSSGDPSLDANCSFPPEKEASKFWSRFDPFLQDITQENIKDLERIIAKCEESKLPRPIPPLGRHYAARWAEEDLVQENVTSNGVEAMLNYTASHTASGPAGPSRLAQGLSDILEMDSASETESESANSLPGVSDNPERRIPLQTILKKRLEDAGFHCSENEDDYDEIFDKLTTCQQKLKSVATKNYSTLMSIKNKAMIDMQKQVINKRIWDVDNQLAELYKKMVDTKLKNKQLQKSQLWEGEKLLELKRLLEKELEQFKGVGVVAPFNVQPRKTP